LKYLPDELAVIKNDLFVPPIIFDLIQQSSQSTDMEMYQVFNMGTRLEIYTDEQTASSLIGIAQSFGVEAKIIGSVIQSPEAYVQIDRIGKEPIRYPAPLS
jgi:phosphoribosylformylglycinamidine cyclo-ligase